MRLFLLTLAVLLPFVARGESKENIDPLRPYLDKLITKDRVKETDFKYPFLMAQTAVAVLQPASKLADGIREFVGKGKLPAAGHYSGKGVSASRFEVELPEAAKQGNQLEGIKLCTVEKCLMKLNTAKEKSLMEASSNKVGAYEKLISSRLHAFLLKRELLGYEERESNQEYVKKMLAEFEFFGARYPQISKFFLTGFWKGEAAPATLVGTSLRQELVVLAPDRLQPIWRMGEVFEFAEKGSWVFFELHIYSNHYMDSSLRIYEVFPVEKKSAIVITDIMEIDELTKSSLIRMLYRGKMEDAVSEAQNQDLEKILP